MILKKFKSRRKKKEEKKFDISDKKKVQIAITDMLLIQIDHLTFCLYSSDY